MQRAFLSVGRFLTMAFIMGHLCAAVLAHSPMLHHWLHGDLDEPDHHCAATALINGQLDQTIVSPAVAMAPFFRQISDSFANAMRQPLVALHSDGGCRAPPLA